MHTDFHQFLYLKIILSILESEMKNLSNTEFIKSEFKKLNSLFIKGKFDLVIDWGVMYFITKPLFFGIDYFSDDLPRYADDICKWDMPCWHSLFMGLVQYFSLFYTLLFHPPLQYHLELLQLYQYYL